MMITLLFVWSLLSLTSCHVLLQSASGEVNRSNFIYWSLNYNGNILIKLISLSGDADLYISERISKPDYEPERYDLHAASCGVDIVQIPNSFKRPVGIGIYGHPSYENSTYLLEIYYDTETEEKITDLEKGIVEPNQNGDDKNNDKSKFKISKNILFTSFWAMMEVLELLFA